MTGRPLLAYCIRGADAAPLEPGVTGVEGVALLQVEVGGLAIVLSEERSGPVTVARIRAHDAVVRAAMAGGTPLPLRYGTRLRDENEARMLLGSRAAEFAGSLERVAGRVEMGVRVLWREPRALAARPAPAPRSGREYLEARRAEMRADEESQLEASSLLDRLEGYFPGIPAVRRVGGGAGVVGSVAHLVQGSAVIPYRSLVRTARAELAEADLFLTGPWAPYSFV
jgi:hypothetical protein